MHDSVLSHLRNTLHERLTRHGEHGEHGEHGDVDQARGAGRLFAGDYSASATVGEEFGDSRLGVGVMHDLDGEVISLHGTTWRVPVDGTPREVAPDEGVAFGVAAHGGREHEFVIPDGADVEGILAAIDAYLERTHVDHEEVVCAVEIDGDFSSVVLRTVAPPTHDHETLGEIIDDETRFTFEHWSGTLVGFRFPDVTDGQTIPGLHLHAISHDTTTGGHLRNAITVRTTARIWVDELHPIHDVAGTQPDGDSSMDFSRYEGPVS